MSGNSLCGSVHRGRSRSSQKLHLKKLQRAQDRADVAEKRPPPLPPSRKNLSETSLSFHPQPLSPFFTKLPPEIRGRIYEYVYGGKIIHLTDVPKRIVHKVLEIPQIADDQVGGVAVVTPPRLEWMSPVNRVPRPGQFSTTSLALLQTCHAIYKEAIPVLYSHNIFSMSSPLVLLDLHDFVLRPQRFLAIRHLNLHWIYHNYDPEDDVSPPYDPETWAKYWDLVVRMKLDSLSLWISCFNGRDPITMNASWVQPLLKVKGIKRVGVKLRQLEWHMGLTETRLEDMERAIEAQWTSV